MQTFQNGFGIETDLRDYQEQLVISHNVATPASPLAQALFEAYRAADCTAFLALNIKADGIQDLLKPLLDRYQIKNYALFDMSVPEMVVYEKMHLNFFSRQSELETQPVLYDKACGVWMDEWAEDWISAKAVLEHLENGKYVGIISPEIHGRNPMHLWGELQQIKDDKVLLCTDVPLEARRFFT